MKRSLLRLGTIMLTLGILTTTGCQQYAGPYIGFPPSSYAHDFPPPPPPEIRRFDFAKMDKRSRETVINDMLAYHELYDQYLKGVVETYLHTNYSSIRDRMSACRPKSFIKKVKTPPELRIKDDGKFTDDEIILMLTRHIRVLKDRISEHNERVDDLIKDYTRDCLPPERGFTRH